MHAAASPWLLQASLALAPCPPGGAVLTQAFDLAPVRWVIHAVGPIYRGPQDAATLTSAYTQALARADEVGATSVAIPSISTGAYGYPLAVAAAVSVQALCGAVTAVQSVLLVAFSHRVQELALGAGSGRLTAQSRYRYKVGAGRVAALRGGGLPNSTRPVDAKSG